MPIKLELLKSSLQKRVTILFLLGIFIPFIIGNTLIYAVCYNTIEKQIYNSSIKELETYSNYIDYKLTEYDDMLIRITNNNYTLNFLFNYYSVSGLEQFDIKEKLISYLHNQSLNIPKLSGLYIFDTRKNVVYSSGRMDLPAFNIFEEPILNNFDSEQKKSIILGSHKQLNVTRNPDTVISIGRYIRDFFTNEILGFILLDFKYDFFNSSLSYISSDHSLQDNYIILDDKNNIIYSKEDINIDLLSEKILSVYDSESGVQNIKYNSTKYFMIFSTSPYTNWKYINLLPQNLIFKDFKILFIYFFTFLLFPIVALLFSYIYIHCKIVTPIKHLTNGMHQLELGNYGTVLSFNATTEFQVLIQGFNNMSIQINHLVNKVLTAELMQKNAELKALQNQLHPHFLSNTLEALRGRAILQKNFDLALSIKSLSKYMRYIIFAKQDIVTLQQEIGHIADYIDIQNIRFKCPVCYDVNIEPELACLSIPKLLLQPLVENALIHGNPNQTIENLKITITAAKHTDSIKIFISDNGVGMEQTAIEALNTNVEVSYADLKSNSHGIGLYNVNSRIKLFYSASSTLFYERNISGGITVTITIYEELSNDKSITL